MSLDVDLIRKRWISYDEGKTHEEEEEIVYSANITHNLNKMATAAGLYEALWRPYLLKTEIDFGDDYQAEWEFEESQTILAKELIPAIENGLKALKADPEGYKKFDSPNGWGVYDNFVPFVENYLNACKEYPEAIVKTCR